MISMKATLVCAAVMVLSGCVSQASYDTSREALRGSPAVRTDFINNCVSNISRKSLAQRQAMAKIMNTSVRNTPSVYCRRVTNGITSGRMTRDDMNAAARGQVTPATVRILQGR